VMGISLGDALFTKGQQRVLALLFGQTDKSFYLNEVVRHGAMGKGAISRELAKLADAGVLVVRQQGNQRHYQANINSPIFAELQQIVLKTFGAAGVLRNGLKPILGEVQHAFIYGSIAKGEDHGESDIDLMLVGSDLSYSEVMDLLQPIELQLKRVVNPTLYAPEEFAERLASGQNFLSKVMAQPQIDLMGN